MAHKRMLCEVLLPLLLCGQGAVGQERFRFGEGGYSDPDVWNSSTGPDGNSDYDYGYEYEDYEESDPLQYRKIFKDHPDDPLTLPEGPWEVMDIENHPLLYEPEFVDLFLPGEEEQQLQDGQVVLIEGAFSFNLRLNGTEAGPEFSELKFTCTCPLTYPPTNLTLTVTDYDGHQVDLVSETEVVGNEVQELEGVVEVVRENRVLSVTCSASYNCDYSRNCFTTETHMQADIHYTPTQVTISSPPELQSEGEMNFVCTTDSAFPQGQVDLVWSVDGVKLEQNSSTTMGTVISPPEHQHEMTEFGDFTTQSTLSLARGVEDEEGSADDVTEMSLSCTLPEGGSDYGPGTELLLHWPEQLTLTGPSTTTPNTSVTFSCSSSPAEPPGPLVWRVEGQLWPPTDQTIGPEGTNSSVTFTPDGSTDQVTVVCAVPGRAKQLHRQKMLKVIGGEQDGGKPAEVWKVVFRQSKDEEFSVPEGFQLVDINENNFRNYVSRIQHLLNEDVGQKMPLGLAGFVKQSESTSAPPLDTTTTSQPLDLLPDLFEDWELPTDEPMKETTEESPLVEAGTECAITEYGCCSGLAFPQHGDSGLGCCTSSQYGCCPDHLTPSPGPYYEGCSCSSSLHGCCPDGLTPATGPGYRGCGCQYSEYGCCLDQLTEAEGFDFEGCHCSSFSFGCCPDGVSNARGPNMEGCDHCQHFAHGCCEDGLTPSPGPRRQGCGCESSRYGCCLEGAPASGPNFLGCKKLPGEVCHLPSQAGGCSEYQDLWFFNMEYGGCARFWYSGCDPGQNHFLTEEGCTDECVSPRGSAVCYLPSVAGSCEGEYMEWFYDTGVKACRQFQYGGCLGNGNRFQTKKDCQSTCMPQEDEEVCKKPKAEGACSGDHPRWYFDQEAGKCSKFSYSGCLGNNNRFMTEDECQSTCQHAVKALKSERTCLLYPDVGDCKEEGNQTLARWSYHPYNRRCVPFYYTGCGGNENNFPSQTACETVCPTSYSPKVSVEAKEVLLKRGEAEGYIGVTVKANPAPNVTWRHNGRLINEYDSQYRVQDDFSLLLLDLGDHHGGNYTITGDNGVGEAVTKEVYVIIYPVQPSIRLIIEKTIFEPNSEVEIVCRVKGYPPPHIQWYKRVYRQGEIPLASDGLRVTVDTFQETQLVVVGRLAVRQVTEEDTATYRCQATAEGGTVLSKSTSLSIQYGPGENCVDSKSFRLCPLVVRHALCADSYYGQFCCRTCMEAGQMVVSRDIMTSLN